MNGMDYWQRQEPGKPLFPDLLWSRPENRQFAGKLLIVGGNSQGFAAPAEAYAAAGKAGIGVARVLLPDVLQKTVGNIFTAGEFAPSTPSGSFGQKALLELLAMAQWADGVLVGGDLGRNSETAILLETFAAKYSGQLTVSTDAADYAIMPGTAILGRPDTSLVLNFNQLQKLAIQAKFTTAFTSSMDFLRLIAALHDFSRLHHLTIILQHLDTLFLAVDGRISTTKYTALPTLTDTAAYASVWWLQNPAQPFQALSTAIANLVVKPGQ